ncbi:acyltransferase family protein [Jeotgalibaca sp. A127]|uniref:acyltransferase family protein n=1 Tax=Jeotgalibaca sp. A127 TaxID=3457324 RepID=UPI003FD47175
MNKNKRIEIFDGMRGLAAIVVLIFHIINWTPAGYAAGKFEFINEGWRWFTTSPLKILWAGNEAVVVFYLIAGFVIAKPYIEGRDVRFGSFVEKRFTRLVLPYWAILLVTFGLIVLFGHLKDSISLSGSFNVKWSEVPEVGPQLLMMEHDLDTSAGAFWSIILEWWVALVIPFVGVALRKFPTGDVVAVSLAVSWVLMNFPGTLGRAAFYFLFFLVGAVLAKHLDQVRSFYRDRKWVLASALILVPFQWIVGDVIDRRTALLFTAAGLVLVTVAIIESPFWTRVFKSPLLLFLGRISFSLYLTHTTSIVLFVTLAGQVVEPLTALLVSPVFAIGMAVLWYRYVENGVLAGVTLPRLGQRVMGK